MLQIAFFGATGFIGGAVLDALLREFASDDVKVQALVRTQDQAARLSAQYPTVSCTIGRTEDHGIVEQLCRYAHIVINCAPDITHDADIKAMLKGLSGRASDERGYYIHTAGATLICSFAECANNFVKCTNNCADMSYMSSEGDESEPTGRDDGRLWDDLDDIEDIKALSPKHSHAQTDKLVRDAATTVNVAIMCPGGVSGLSPSQEHPTPMGVPVWGGAIRTFGGPFQIGPGEARGAIIHVLDLAAQYLVLLRDAILILGSSSGTPPPPPPFPMWGPDALYFGVAENAAYGMRLQKQAEMMAAHGDARFARLRTERRTIAVAEAARATLAGQTGDEYDPDAPLPPADSWVMHLAAAYGRSMKVRATRMERLGWRPVHKCDEDLAEVIAKAIELGKL